ncbi:hypothetical protein QCN29_30320 [Streptomyces sp. HNM0663]|uniref:Uncharacterized protein n=1 Tax=Streptomyces chengmaiensis TaxID=3040919 RepID=A0ABT6HWB3_9ACTN|nr:hypothetical protein [Streptomyces chengmaiensis]MDH2392997.1 hypothetical protein [Streptomyces chengmaiensis]
MHATTDLLDVETFANPVQQRRFVAAMERIAVNRATGTPVRVYVSTGPQMLNSSKWDRMLARITERLPDGVEVLHFRNTFSSDHPYDWDTVVGDLDGLVILGRQKRPGSRVFVLGPLARLELRSLVAQKPVLIYTHNLGLIPVIDCKSQVLGPEDAPRLKLIAPKRWQRDSATLKAALNALDPARAEASEKQRVDAPNHLARPFVAAPPR